MSDRVFRELPADFVRRMRNWARWASGGQDRLGYPSVHPMWSQSPRSPRAELPVGIISGEAGDTNASIDAIPVRYAQAVRLFWQYESTPIAQLARRCGNGVDYRTYEKRVIDGHQLLRAEIARRADAARLCAERYAVAAA